MNTRTFNCSNCGEEVEINAKKCPNCGAVFEEEEETEEQGVYAKDNKIAKNVKGLGVTFFVVSLIIGLILLIQTYIIAALEIIGTGSILLTIFLGFAEIIQILHDIRRNTIDK